MTPLRRVSLIASVALLLSCSGTTEPVAGTLRVNLTNPTNGHVGAVLLAVSGPVAPLSASAAPGLALWGSPVNTTPARVVLTGSITSGTILTLQVEDINRVGEYVATLLQVADSSTLALQSLSNYSVTVTK